MTTAMTLRSSAVVLTLALTATVARGQGCILITDNPPDLKGASINIGKIADDGQSARPSEKPTHFRRTLTLLYENTAGIKNQIGRQYLLGRLYAVWLNVNLPGTKTITTREDLKLFGGDPKRAHDLYMAMDSAFAKVEAENASCADSTAKYRGAVSQMAYNEARTQLEAKKYDSAVVLAKRALVADPKGAAPWNILAEANKQRGDTAGFRQALRKVSEAIGTDAQMKRVKSQAYYNLAIMEMTDAAKASGEEQKRLAAQAEADLKEFLKLVPGDPQATTALGRVYMIKGDTAAAKSLMDDILKSPAKYSAAALFEVAGAQFAAGEFASANDLYEIGLSKNPMLRDALFSYISSLLKADKRDKALEVARKMLSVDPNGQNTLTQVAAVWSAMYQAAADDAARAKVQDSLLFYTAARTTGSAYVNKVTITPGTDGATVEAVVNNMTDTPKTVQVEFDFLNAAGAVVSSGTATATNVPAKTGMQISVKGTGAGIVAWRYKPLK